MKKFISVLIAFIISPLLLRCQTTDKTANEAFVLIRMVNKFHVEPREVNGAFSRNVFTGILDKTDGDRIFFTKNDISRLSVYRATLDNEIKHRKTGYLSLFINIYRQRLKQADSMIDEINKKPFDFYATEKLTVAEDTSYPPSLAAAQQKLYKIIKAGALDELTDNIPGNFKSFAPAKQKKYADSVIVILRKRAASSVKRRINNILQNPYGIIQYIGDIYCETIASCFDPHTEFFPPEEKENFESELGRQPFKFGFKMKPDKNGGILIDNLEPGSPAFKSGKLNKGDKFMSLQWEGGQPVDVSDITIHEFALLVDQSNHKQIVFTIKKADGSIVQVPLQKEQTAGEDGDRVKSFVLKGNNNAIGYIYLPAFYEDWEAGNVGLNGCANDVGREILKLKKENITGLILDVRYNGGGSVREATELAGIFIDAGPVAQEKSRDAKVVTIKDMDRGTIYDGPLVILVNGYSASASELLAGTLQDYNRAVIVGSPTYGKATMQVVLPMDTTITPENFSEKNTENYLKVTISKLYRVTGATAQFKGVQPDILLPDILDAYTTKETGEPYALLPTTISANKYYTAYPPLPIKALAQSVQTEIDTSKFFNDIKTFITASKQKKAEKDIPLNLKDALADLDSVKRDDDDDVVPGVESKKFTVKNNLFELDRLQTDSTLKELNDDFKHQVAADAYISIAYDVLVKLKP
ncbi:MAG: prc 2 [Mucilaginibacter sp.]|nr:prc 2 [Mucilaginibacter sp.]